MAATFQFNMFGRWHSIPAFYFLLALMIAGTFVRFYKLDYTGLWLDEIYSMKGADISSTFSDIYEYSKFDQPPAFFIILNLWFKAFGYNEYSGRALTSTFGVIGIFAIYLLGKEVKGEQAGLFAAFVTTINWFHVGISVEIRFYALVFLLSTLSYLFFIRALKKAKFLTLMLYVVCTSLLLNTHYFGMVLFTTQLIAFIVYVITFRPRVQFILPLLVAGTLALLSILHWLPVIFHDLEIKSFHVKPLTARNFIKFFWWYFYDPAAMITSVVLCLFAFDTLYKNLRLKKFSMEEMVICTWLTIGFLIPLIYSLVRMPLFTNKYCTIQVPVMFVLLSLGFVTLNVRTKTIVVVVMLISAAIVLFIARPPYKKSFHEDGRELAIMYFNTKDADKKTWNEDWREVANYFKDQGPAKQTVFSQLSWFHEYYFKKYGLDIPVNHNSEDVASHIDGVDSVWLLLHDHYRNGSMGMGFSIEQQQVIRNKFDLTDLVRFRKSKALLYKRKESDPN